MQFEGIRIYFDTTHECIRNVYDYRYISSHNVKRTQGVPYPSIKQRDISIQKFDKIDSGGTSEQAESCVISNNDKEISIYCFLKDICTHRRTGGNFLGGRAKIARKILLHKIMHMISSTVNILQLVFTYFIIYVRS